MAISKKLVANTIVAFHIGRGGQFVGLTILEANTDMGCINIDNSFDTIYTRLLKDCDEKELDLIAYYDGYLNLEIREYAEKKLNS